MKLQRVPSHFAHWPPDGARLRLVCFRFGRRPQANDFTLRHRRCTAGSPCIAASTYNKPSPTRSRVHFSPQHISSTEPPLNYFFLLILLLTLTHFAYSTSATLKIALGNILSSRLQPHASASHLINSQYPQSLHQNGQGTFDFLGFASALALLLRHLHFSPASPTFCSPLPTVMHLPCTSVTTRRHSSGRLDTSPHFFPRRSAWLRTVG